MRIGFHSPLVPPEWIAAHGLEPFPLQPNLAGPSSRPETTMGGCPFAEACVDPSLLRGLAGAVLTTHCDQLRRAADDRMMAAPVPLFLLNVPATWTTSTALRLYRNELERLGRFLVGCGGTPPAVDHLGGVLRRYEQGRRYLLARSDACPAAALAPAIRHWQTAGVVEAEWPTQAAGGGSVNRSIRLATLGELSATDHAQWIVQLPRLRADWVLDGSGGGERVLQRAWPKETTAIERDPLEAMAEAYLRGVPEIFQRPNRPLHDWLRRRVREREVAGVLLLRAPWCDLWAAELPRLRESAGVPVLGLEVGVGDGLAARELNRLEAFMESLASTH